MKCDLSFEVNINATRLALQHYIKTDLAFKNVNSEYFYNGGSKFSTNHNAVKIVIDTSSYPLVTVIAESYFFNRKVLRQILKEWQTSILTNVESANRGKTVFTSIALINFNQLSILTSRYFLPVMVMFFISFITYVALAHEVMCGVYQIILNDIENPGVFNKDFRIRPIFFEVYNQADIWYGSLLLALLGGGFSFALKNIFFLLIICNVTFTSKRPFLFLLIFFLSISFLLTPKTGVLIFSLILGIGMLTNFFLFNLLIRNKPYFVKKLK